MRALACAAGMLLVGSGCHLLLPMASSSDAVSRGDGPAGRPTDAASLDGRRREAPPAACSGVRSDALSLCPTGVCMECDPLPVSPCEGCCPRDGDCDGLPDPRDPSPAACNTPRFADGFEGTPTWIGDPGGNVTASPCGVLQVSAGSNSNTSVHYQLAELQGALLETRITTLPAFKGAHVAIDGDSDAPLHGQQKTSLRRCLVVSEGNGSFKVRNEVMVSSTYGPIKESSVLTFVAPVVLQSLMSGGIHHCRLFVEGWSMLDTSAASTGTPSGPYTILDVLSPNGGPTVIGQFDYLRAFDP